MAQPPSTVVIIDDDPAIRETLGSLVQSVGLQATLFGHVRELLAVGMRYDDLLESIPGS